MKKVKIIGAGIGMLASLLAPATEKPLIVSGGESTVQQQNKEQKKVLVQTQIQNQYTAPERLNHLTGRTKRKPWKRGSMSRFKQQKQFKKYSRPKSKRK